MKNTRIISGLIVLSVAIIAFILSFKNIAGLAYSNGYEDLSFLVPFVIDLPIIAFSISAMVSTLKGDSNKKELGLIALFTAVSIVFNIAHSNMQLIGIGIAVLIPSALFLSFHSFMHQVEGGVKESRTINTIQGLVSRLEELKVEQDKLTDENEKLNFSIEELDNMRIDIERAIEQKRKDFEQWRKEKELKIESEIEESKQRLLLEIEQLKNERDLIKSEKENASMPLPKQLMIEYLRNNEGARYDDIAAVIGKSKGTISNYANDLIESGVLIKNGVGLKVKT